MQPKQPFTDLYTYEQYLQSASRLEGAHEWRCKCGYLLDATKTQGNRRYECRRCGKVVTR